MTKTNKNSIANSKKTKKWEADVAEGEASGINVFVDKQPKPRTKQARMVRSIKRLAKLKGMRLKQFAATINVKKIGGQWIFPKAFADDFTGRK